MLFRLPLRYIPLICSDLRNDPKLPPFAHLDRACLLRIRHVSARSGSILKQKLM